MDRILAASLETHHEEAQALADASELVGGSTGSIRSASWRVSTPRRWFVEATGKFVR